ncbi:hypothetical protein CPC08DRAFT_730904 [Agrocybe pediades]|nr:hypothetical protein CPC08DRAFT_730904 [Agrocybe pediades]
MDHKKRPKRMCRRPERYDEDREAAEEAARVQARRSAARRRRQQRSSPAPSPEAPSNPQPPLPNISTPPVYRPVYCGRRPQRVSTAAWNNHPQSAPFFQVLNGTWDARVPVPLQGFMHPFLHGLYMYSLPCNNCLKRGEPCFLGWYEGATGFSCVACRIKWKKKCCKSDQIYPDIILRRLRPSEQDLSLPSVRFWYTLARSDGFYPVDRELCHPPGDRSLPVEITLLGHVNPYLRESGPYEDVDEEWEKWKRRKDMEDDDKDDADDEDDEGDDDEGGDDGGDSPDEAEGTGRAEGGDYEDEEDHRNNPPWDNLSANAEPSDTALNTTSPSPGIVKEGEPLFLPDEDDDREVEKAWLEAVLAISPEAPSLELHAPRRLDLRTVQHPSRLRTVYYPSGYFTSVPPPSTATPSATPQIVITEQNAIAESFMADEDCPCPPDHSQRTLPTPPSSPPMTPHSPQLLRRSTRLHAARSITPTPPAHRPEFVEGSSRQPPSYRRPPRINPPVPFEFEPLP